MTTSMHPSGAGEITTPITSSETFTEEEYPFTGWRKTYSLEATLTDPYSFYCFDIHSVRHSPERGEEHIDSTLLTNPARQEPGWTNDLSEYSIDYPDGRHYDQSITSVEAFAKYHAVKVSVFVAGDGAVANGCSATVDGMAYTTKILPYDYDYYTTVELSVEPQVGWSYNGAVTSAATYGVKERSLRVPTYPIYGDEEIPELQLRARFIIANGLPVYGSSGKIARRYGDHIICKG